MVFFESLRTLDRGRSPARGATRRQAQPHIYRPIEWSRVWRLASASPIFESRLDFKVSRSTSLQRAIVTTLPPNTSHPPRPHILSTPWMTSMMSKTRSKSPMRRHELPTDRAPRFGNFIGEEAEASEDGSQNGADAGNYVYDDEYAEEDQEAGQELMEIDGNKFHLQREFPLINLADKTRCDRWTLKCRHTPRGQAILPIGGAGVRRRC